MIAPVTIYVPVPTGASAKAGAAQRFAAPRIAGPKPVAQPGARAAANPVEGVARLAGEGGQHKRMSGFEAALADREARSSTARRHLRAVEDEESRAAPNTATTDATASDATTITDAAGPRQTDRAVAAEAAGAMRPLAPHDTSLSAPLQGPGRSLAIDALYRLIESFAGDPAPRGAIFDFRI